MIKLLDCTLRDGGYINDWEFGHDNILNIFERVTDSGVEAIEIGFLDDKRGFDLNRSIFPNTKSLTECFKSIKNRPELIVAMINYGTCELKNIEKCENTFIDAIRVMVQKPVFDDAIAYCKQLKKLGYKVIVQLVSTTGYIDKELVAAIKKINVLNPFAVSIVDTYGLLYPSTLKHYVLMLDKYLNKNIGLGFHGHNNLQMAVINSFSFSDFNLKRNCYVDGTLFGMGKSAGNAPIELIAKHLNENHKKKYNISSLLETIEESVLPFYTSLAWGYQPFYFICANNECNHRYLTYFKSKGKLSVSNLNKLMSLIKKDKRLLFDRDYAEQIYCNFVGNIINSENTNKFINSLNKHKILLIGPGYSIENEKEKIFKYIKKYKPIVISVNFVPENFKIDYLFVTNSIRYKKMIGDLNRNKKFKIIGTSNINDRNNDFYTSLNYDQIKDNGAIYEDNSFLMLLKFLDLNHVKSVMCAGFDGYSRDKRNYYDLTMNYNLSYQDLIKLNEHVKNIIKSELKIEVDFLTYTRYSNMFDNLDN